VKVGLLIYSSENNVWQHHSEPFNSFIEGLQMLSKEFDIVAWCYHIEEKKYLENYIKNTAKPDIHELVTFGSDLFLDNTEYLESSNVFFNQFSKNINNDYDTWRSRSNGGYTTSSIIEKSIKYQFPADYKTALAVFSYFAYRVGAIVRVVNSMGLNTMSLGGLTEREYLKFVSYTKKKKWILYYMISRFVFDKKIITPVKYLFNTNYQEITPENLWNFDATDIDFDQIKVDAFIPTLGRPEYVLQTLKDINQLDVHIRKFIIVEQILPGQKGTLLQNVLDSQWNFEIEHVLLDQLGLCNARNVGLAKSDADYIIMFDDDIRIADQPDLIKNLVVKLEKTQSDIISFASNSKQGTIDIKLSNDVAGCSTLFKNGQIEKFNLQIEGMGSDDQEYNYKVHSIGKRVVYTDQEYMNHLRAPMGGWRFDAKEFLPWFQDNGIVPLPGPVTLHRFLLYSTEKQLKGFKFFIFHRYYKFKLWKLKEFNKRWDKSLNWAKEIMNDRVKLDIKKGIKTNS